MKHTNQYNTYFESVNWMTSNPLRDLLIAMGWICKSLTVAVQLLSHVWLLETPWTGAGQIHVHCADNAIKHLILCQSFPLLSSIFPSISLFQWVGSLHQVAKYWSLSFSHSHSNEYSGLMSLKIDWIDLLAVWGNLKSLLQHHKLKATILQHSVFFMVQLSHLYMTTGKTLALTIWTFVSKVICLLFNTLSMFITAFHPRSKCLLPYWMILEPKKIKICHCFHCFPSICCEIMGPDAMILVSLKLHFKPAF